MKIRKRLLIISLPLVLLGIGVLAVSFGNADDGQARALLRNAAGNPVGEAKLIQEEEGVLVRVVVHDLPPGFHGFHVHTVGSCVAPSFTSAGGHFNPAEAGHPGHAGDMPVLLVNSDGSGQARFTTDRFMITELTDSDGSALIVHANPDNYGNIPRRYNATFNVSNPDSTTLATGDAGGRIACGVIQSNSQETSTGLAMELVRVITAARQLLDATSSI